MIISIVAVIDEANYQIHLITIRCNDNLPICFVVAGMVPRMNFEAPETWAQAVGVHDRLLKAKQT